MKTESYVSIGRVESARNGVASSENMVRYAHERLAESQRCNDDAAQTAEIARLVEILADAQWISTAERLEASNDALKQALKAVQRCRSRYTGRGRSDTAWQREHELTARRNHAGSVLMEYVRLPVWERVGEPAWPNQSTVLPYSQPAKSALYNRLRALQDRRDVLAARRHVKSCEARLAEQRAELAELEPLAWTEESLCAYASRVSPKALKLLQKLADGYSPKPATTAKLRTEVHALAELGLVDGSGYRVSVTPQGKDVARAANIVVRTEADASPPLMPWRASHCRVDSDRATHEHMCNAVLGMAKRLRIEGEDFGEMVEIGNSADFTVRIVRTRMAVRHALRMLGLPMNKVDKFDD